MNLPRGLFLEPIKLALKKTEGTNNLIAELHEMEGNGVTYNIIKRYYDLILNDGPQEFYNYDSGNFTEVKSLNSKISSNEKEYLENEKKIRLIKTCDMVLFLCIKEFLEKEFVVDDHDIINDTSERKKEYSKLDIENVKLNSTNYENLLSILNFKTKIDYRMKFTYETNPKKIFKEKDAVSLPSGLDERTIVCHEMKIKNNGKFRSLLKDRRINSMLPYLPKKEINYNAMKKELEFFGKARRDVFYRIYKFEEDVIYAKCPPKNKSGFINHKVLLKSVLNENDPKYNQILELRNAFSHSNYPEYELFKDKGINGNNFNDLIDQKYMDDSTNDKSIIVQLKNRIIQLYDSIQF